MHSNIIHMLGGSLYNAASTLTGMVGLTPLDLGLVLICFMFVMFLVQIYSAFKGKTSFTLEDYPKVVSSLPSPVIMSDGE